VAGLVRPWSDRLVKRIVHSQKLRRRLTLLVAAMLLTMPGNSEPTLPEANAIDPPTAEELRHLEGLAQWVGGDGEHRPRLSRSWARALRADRAGFELFTNFHPADESDEVLAEMRFGPAIRSAAERHGLDPLLVAAVVEHESGFRPWLVSHRGAVGLMQLMPSTFGENLDLTDPELNLDQGCRYLAGLLERYSGDLELALAAYNAGLNAVSRYGGVPPFAETRGFVEKVLGSYVRHQRQVWTNSGAVALFELR
jgi:hypothetical protein